MQGIKRRIVYVALYEAIAIACTTAGLTGLADHDAGDAGLAAVLASATAVAWNVIYNTLFEAWEAKQTKGGRSLLRRIVHAIGFEGGLVLAIVPMFAWTLGTSLVDAFLLDLGLVVFFTVYSFAFNWAFDLVFGLPTAALGRAGDA
ncbi:PACE efflux transporter [Massilia putida]|uniref:PACE efflux transporter n=1 Tax=Massilia putida TaxID=1141883 RepID=UPI00095101FA|nr:PACE efflux transporter [Massilia putida]